MEWIPWVVAALAIGWGVGSSIFAARTIQETNRELHRAAREHRESMAALTRSTLESGRVIQPVMSDEERERMDKMAEDAAKAPVDLRREHKRHVSMLNDIVYRTLDREDQ